MVRSADLQGPLPTDPSPDEIRRAAEAIRARWSDRERTKRASIKPMQWLPPVIQDHLWADSSSDADAFSG